DNGSKCKIITRSTGSYELSAINDEIQSQMIVNGDYDTSNNNFYIAITANTSKLSSVIEITNQTYKIDFTFENSIGQTLGFNKIILNYGYNESQNIVDIMKINSILVNIDIITGSYVNDSQFPVIYSFFPNVSPRHKIVKRPNTSLNYYPVNRSDISYIRLWLTDQDNKPVDIRCERITVIIIIREVINIKDEIKSALQELKKENIT